MVSVIYCQYFKKKKKINVLQKLASGIPVNGYSFAGSD